MKKTAKQWINVVDFNPSEVTYRITFECCPEDYKQIVEEIRGYGEIFDEKMEV